MRPNGRVLTSTSISTPSLYPSCLTLLVLSVIITVILILEPEVTQQQQQRYSSNSNLLKLIQQEQQDDRAAGDFGLEISDSSGSEDEGNDENSIAAAIASQLDQNEDSSSLANNRQEDDDNNINANFEGNSFAYEPSSPLRLLASNRPSLSQLRQQQRQQQGEIDNDSNDNLIPSSVKRDEIYILEDKDYPKSLFEHHQGVGRVSGITTLPQGDVAIFHRAERDWDNKTFEANFTVPNWQSAQEQLIKDDTILIIDGEDGSSVTSFGSNLFYMPHGITSDNMGNLWITDVARHQVMRLPTSELQVIHKSGESTSTSGMKKRWLPGNMTRLWPDIILGEAFVPGKDEAHFCQPTSVAVSSDGRLVYVADGYCNSRVVVFTGTGRYITSFGQHQGMSVVHSLVLFEERNLVCVADRENARILCYKGGLDGDLESIGEPMLNINYPLGRVFAIAGISPSHLLVSSNQFNTFRFDMAALNPFTSELKQAWTSSDLLYPHSLAATRDYQYAYAADISKDAFKKVFKFNVIQRQS